MIGRIQNFALRGWKKMALLALRTLPLARRSEAIAELAPGMAIRTPARGEELLMLATTPLLLSRAQNLLHKEPDTLAWIDRFPEDAIFWDVGANVGTFSLYAALKPQMTVLAFEPGAANYDVLCRNIQLNQFANIRAYCLALARETRLGVLNMASADPGTALNQFGDSGDISRYADRSATPVVQGMVGWSMDDFIAQFQPPFPQFLKIDVDGLEWPIMQGAEKSLRDPRLQSVLLELTVSDATESAQAMDLFKDCGFELLSRGEPQTAGGEEGRNHIFARPGVFPGGLQID